MLSDKSGEFSLVRRWGCYKMAKVSVILIIFKIWFKINLWGIFTCVSYCWIYIINVLILSDSD